MRPARAAWAAARRALAGRRGEAARALGAAVFATLLVALAFSRAWPLTLDIGEHDARFVAGFNEVEHFGSQSVRWTTADSTIALPRPPGSKGVLLSMRIISGRPQGQPDGSIQIKRDGQPLLDFYVTRDIDGERVYQTLVPPDRRFDWAVHFDLSSSTFSLANDPRQLGSVVERVTLKPVGGGWRPPSLWLIAWSAVLGLLGYAFPRSVGLRPGAALALAAGLALLVAIGVAARPMDVLPYIHRIAALLGLGCLGIWAARCLAPPTSDGAPRIRGADLPIYLAVAWWMGPLFQVILTADGARSVSPPVPTAWIGAAGAAALLVGVGGWRLWRGRALPAQQRAPIIARWSLALLAVAALAQLAYMLWFAFQRQGPDFWILFKGARDWARGGSLYDLSAIVTDHFGHVFKVPPFYGMLFVPFVFDDGERILLFHRMINLALIAATALAWLRMWRLPLRSAATAGVLVLLNFRPIADTLAFGQIDLALLLILTLALWALRRDRDLLAGALIALGTLFKIYPVLLLAFLLFKRRWRGLAGFALGMLVLNGLAIAVMGWEMHRVYLTEVLPRIGGSTAWVENQTIDGFLARLIDSPTEAAIFQNRALTLLGLALSGALGLLACLLALRPARPDSTTYALQYGQFALLMVLIIPAAWMHYETLLFLPFAALLLHLRDRQVGLARAAALALSFALIAYGNQWSFYDGTVMGTLTIAGVSYKFYGMLLLGAVLVGELLPRPLALGYRWLPRVGRGLPSAAGEP